MKIYLTRDDVFKILLDHFGIRYFKVSGGDKVLRDEAEIYWEGNEDSDEAGEK